MDRQPYRPFPAPSSPWIMEHTWHDLLFAHWPMPAHKMQRLLPAGVQADLYDGTAWLGVIPFRLTNIHLRDFPPMPLVSSFTELNVRTYVTCDGKPGVYFFSLDADSLFNVAVARSWYRLNYRYARMSVKHHEDEVWYRSRRLAAAPAPEFQAAYRPTASPGQSAQGSIEYFLTERYCLYTAGRGGILCGEIHHEPWPLQPAEADIEVNTMAWPLGLKLRREIPLLHFARKIDVRVWPLCRIQPSTRRNARLTSRR